MLHILWIMVKVIGIVCGVLAGLLLLALLLLLFCPVRYRARAAKGSEPVRQAQAALCVSWLFGGLRLQLTYQDGALLKDVNISGISIWKFLRNRGAGGETPSAAPKQEAAPERQEAAEKPPEAAPKQEAVPERQEAAEKPPDASKQKGSEKPSAPQAAEDSEGVPPRASFFRRLWNRIRAFWEKLRKIPYRIAAR